MVTLNGKQKWFSIENFYTENGQMWINPKTFNSMFGIKEPAPRKKRWTNKAASTATKTDKPNEKVVLGPERNIPKYNPHIKILHTPLTVMEKNTTSFRFFHETKYYVQSEKGNVTIDGVKYFEANSQETVTLYPVYDIDYNFQRKGYVNRLKDALPDERLSYNEKVKYVFNQSPTGKALDQKQFLSKNKLYLFSGKLYNKNEAGNIIWGGALRQMGFSKAETVGMAHGGTLILEKRLDESHDQRALQIGWHYQDYLIKQSRKK